MHNPPSTQPTWPRRVPSLAGGRISAKHLLCAVLGAAVLALAPATALAAKTPSPDPAPGTSKPKPQPKPTPTHTTTPTQTHTTPKTTYTPPATTHTTPTVTHYSPPATTHKTVVHKAKKKHHAARHHKHHAVVHHKKKHVAAAPKATPAPVQQPAPQVVNTKPTAQTLPVLPHKTSKDGGNGSLLAFAALALLLLAGGSAWLLRLTLRLAQPQRT